jgi:hypothetical protein
MRIVNFGQVIDLEHGGGFAHQFTVALDSGERLSIITDEDTVQQLIEIAMVMPPSEEVPRHLRVVEPDPGHVMTRRVQQMMEEVADEVSDDPGELAAYEPTEAPVMGKVAEAPVQGIPRGIHPGGLGQPKPPVKRQPMIDEDGFMVRPPSKTVPTDEMGYPIISGGRREQDEEDEQEVEDIGESI